MNSDDVTKKNRILDAATVAFAKNGFADTTIGDIAKKAKVASGSVYLYFEKPPKLDILLSIILRFWNDLLTLINQRVDQNMNPWTKLETTIEILGEMLFKQKQAVYLARTLHESIPYILPRSRYLMEKRTQITKRNGEFLAFVDKIIEEGQELGEFTDALKPSVMRQVLYGSFEMLVYGLYLKLMRNEDVGYDENDMRMALIRLSTEFLGRQNTETTNKGGDERRG